MDCNDSTDLVLNVHLYNRPNIQFPSSYIDRLVSCKDIMPTFEENVDRTLNLRGNGEPSFSPNNPKSCAQKRA